MASGAISGSALAPVGVAHASVEHLVPVPPPPAPVSIEPIPVFAQSREERADSALDATRQEVEAFLHFGAREVPRRLVEIIVRAADATGVDAVYLMALADTESSFRPDIKASTSSAEGLFQFIDRTWLDTVSRHGAKYGLDLEADAITLGPDGPAVEDEAMRSRILDLRRDPYVAAVMAAELLKSDAEQIGGQIGRKLNRTEMYLAHFLGLADATRFLSLRGNKRPANAARMFPAAARANAAIFFKTPPAPPARPLGSGGLRPHRPDDRRARGPRYENVQQIASRRRRPVGSPPVDCRPGLDRAAFRSSARQVRRLPP